MIEELKSLGLGHYEAKALEILFKERVSLRELSKKSNIPFGKVYSVVKELKKIGIVLETNSRPKLVYVDDASDIISKLLKEKNEKEKALNDRLREIAMSIDKERNKPSKFFELGISGEERKKIQLRMFNEAEEEILQILNIHHNPSINRQSKNEYEKAHERSVKRGVKTMAIYPKEVILPRILEKLSKKYPDNFQVKRFNTDFPRCDIIDGKKVLIKLAHEDLASPGGTIFFENERFAQNLVKIFSQYWEEAG